MTSKAERLTSKLPQWVPPTANVSASIVPASSATLPAWITGKVALLAIWLLGCSLLTVKFAVARIRLAKLVRRCEPAASPITAVAAEVSASLELRRAVRVVSSRDVEVPFAAGTWRAAVVVPRAVQEWSRARLTAVLRHELAHVARHDGWWQLLAEAAAALYWFNPLAWLAVRALRSERERACDDLVLAGGARSSDYADDLLQIAMESDAVANCAAALAMARRSQLEGRLIAVLTPDRKRTASRRVMLCVAVAALALAIPVAALHAQQGTNTVKKSRSAPHKGVSGGVSGGVGVGVGGGVSAGVGGGVGEGISTAPAIGPDGIVYNDTAVGDPKLAAADAQVDGAAAQLAGSQAS
ncbi:MAG TPA: M56 family metallopeptidase, partial [Ramlibacter sp.]|nr:M56 family metallopeptidase [Ramlibacter sp.]